MEKGLEGVREYGGAERVAGGVRVHLMAGQRLVRTAGVSKGEWVLG